MTIKPWREIAKPHKDIEPLTGLGRKLLAIRRKAIAKGLQLKSLLKSARIEESIIRIHIDAK